MQTEPLYPYYFAHGYLPSNTITQSMVDNIKALPKAPNTFNSKSQSNYVLNHIDWLQPLKAEIQNLINDAYYNDWGVPRERLTPVITQSWFTYSQPREKMHNHAHPNSLLSGVVYIEADPNVDEIYIERPMKYHRLMHYPVKQNQWTSNQYVHNVGQGAAILFDSQLNHYFNEVSETQPQRISLAFNTFLEGTFGDDELLTGLHLKVGRPG